MKNWSKFYTPKSLANEIINRLPDKLEPSVVVDICVGSGNFLDEAIKKWKDIKAIGVDLDLNQINPKKNFKLYQIDALNINLLSSIKIKEISGLKLILANPPFGNIENFESYEYLEDKHKSIYNEAIRTKRIEMLMLVSNLNLLNENDYFGAVLPENFFTSLKLNKFKEMFISEFEDVIIGNKGKFFNNTDVKTRIFIGKYVGRKINSSKKTEKLINKNNYINKLFRGIDNSKLLNHNKGKNIEVLHFSNLKGIQKSKKFFPRTDKINRIIISGNDTLILRVGRNSGYSYQIKKEYIDKAISDYFYLLKDIKLTTKEHELLQDSLISKRKGLTTNYLSKKDIADSVDDVLKKRLAS